MSTSNRRNAVGPARSNPSTKFIDWKSNDKNFSFYDKEKKENVSIPLPFKFLFLDEMHTVKGWSDPCECAIFSNEVKYISKEVMTVKPFKGNEIAKGLYKDIKEKIKAAGAHYVKSIYIMLEDGSIANLQLKGASCKSWGEFTQKTKSRLPDEWVEVANFLEGKKGAVKYYTPVFKFNTSITDEVAAMADTAFNTLEAYMKTYLNRADDFPVENVDVDVEIEEDLFY